MFNLMLAIDWESINWSAVGAIGTAIGSIATAIAVIVAIIQLKQPNKKAIRVDVYKTVDLDIGIVVGVNIINIGNRDVQLRSVHYIVRGKEEILIPINYESIKSTVKIDSAIQVEYKYKNIEKVFKNRIEQRIYKKTDKIIFVVIDSSGKRYYSKKQTLDKFLCIED